MAQHFLKTAASRDFTVNDVAFMTEEDAFWYFVKIRWGDRDHAVCPHCGVVDRHYFRQKRKQWRCKYCDGYFSVTTRSIFEDHKLGFKRILLGLTEYVSSANGISLHALARKMNVQLKTAQAFVGKIRESLLGSRPQIKLEGTVHIDGGHFGGRPRHGRVRKQSKAAITAHVEAQILGKKNQDKAPRRGGRSKGNWIRFKKRRVIMVLRELYSEPGKGAKRTIVAVCPSENETHATQLAQSFIAPGSLVMTDENPAYNQLSFGTITEPFSMQSSSPRWMASTTIKRKAIFQGFVVMSWAFRIESSPNTWQTSPLRWRGARMLGATPRGKNSLYCLRRHSHAENPNGGAVTGKGLCARARYFGHPRRNCLHSIAGKHPFPFGCTFHLVQPLDFSLRGNSLQSVSY